MLGMSFANMMGMIFKEQCETNTCIRLTAPIHIICCYIQTMCLLQRHRYFFIEQWCIRIFLTKYFFVFISYDSSRTELNSICMDNSVLLSAVWLQQIAYEVYFLLWKQTSRWESLLVHNSQRCFSSILTATQVGFCTSAVKYCSINVSTSRQRLDFNTSKVGNAFLLIWVTSF